MAVNTILLDFTVKSSEMHMHEELVTKVLGNYLPQLNKTFNRRMDDGGFLLVLTADRGAFVTVRGFPQGLITLNIEYYKKDSEEEIINFRQITKLEREIAELFGCKKYNKFPPLRRGGINRYYPTSDERILEYDIDEVVFEETSPYQKVQIVHSKTFGNMLILDGLQNLSDRDLIYTETLMQRGKENFAGKEIVILGGGDGALLYELLKENPKLVLMFELDELVIRVCGKHMRECCGNVLDSMKGPNYEIILGDCMKSLEAMIREGRKFDYVFGDLTDVPVSPTPQNEVWDFNHLIIKTSMQILKPSGKYMTHCCGVPCAVKMFEDQLMTIDKNIAFSKATAFIPSFLEDWLFYQIWREQDKN
ncbi:spermine synthase isoform X2 [Cimex lectularius]|uniref:PABS domain-containing protein n=1 Tax=Cimex lectularius TaxID=79782 RepID=A0A8I6RCL3_CIMLE|nr:spermine synthase isoform X2 [Cimex lectularius]